MMIGAARKAFFTAICRNRSCVFTAQRFQWNVAQNVTQAVPSAYRSPFSLIENELRNIPNAIGEELTVCDKKLELSSRYHFDQTGKLFRPTLVLLMAHVVNTHQKMMSRLEKESMFNRQFRVAMVAEMIHTASLIHDDIIDSSPLRRNMPTLHMSAGVKTAVLTGDFILSRASRLIARLGSNSVTEVLSLILEDLVVGELMQAKGAEEDGKDNPIYGAVFDSSSIKPSSRPFFIHYLQRIYYKTASLMANSTKAVGIISGGDPELVKATYDIGRYIGMAFQIMDDLLDVTSQINPEILGKPAAADLSLGLATAPVLFASQEHPELIDLIKRRFSQDGDVETALAMIHQSGALGRTRQLASQHADKAVQLLKVHFADSPHRTALSTLATYVIERNK